MNLKESISDLRSQGKSYREIEKILGCSRSVIAYHTNTTSKTASAQYQKEKRKKFLSDLKVAHGGCCKICKYSRCLEALDFHHVDDSQKLFSIGDGIRRSNFDEITKEADKCVLLCCRCHREVHAGLVQIGCGG